MRRPILISICILFAAFSAFGQKDQFGINQGNIHPSALLDIHSLDKGVLLPRMLEADKNAIGSPADGLSIYQMNNNSGLYFRDQTDWNQLLDGTRLLFPLLKPAMRYVSDQSKGWFMQGQNMVWVDLRRNFIYRFSSPVPPVREISTVWGHIIFEGGNIHEQRSNKNVFEWECEPDSINMFVGRDGNYNGRTIEISHDGLSQKSLPFAVREISGIEDAQQWWDAVDSPLSGIGPDGSLNCYSSGIIIDESVSDPSMGLAKLVNGSVFIAKKDVSAGSRIQLSNNGLSGTAGELYVSIQSGQGFTIHSTSNTDQSEVAWLVIESL